MRSHILSIPIYQYHILCNYVVQPQRQYTQFIWIPSAVHALGGYVRVCACGGLWNCTIENDSFPSFIPDIGDLYLLSFLSWSIMNDLSFFFKEIAFILIDFSLFPCFQFQWFLFLALVFPPFCSVRFVFLSLGSWDQNLDNSYESFLSFIQ